MFDIDLVTEFILWFVIPYAKHNRLEIGETIQHFIEHDSDYLLEMESNDQSLKEITVVTAAALSKSAGGCGSFFTFVAEVIKEQGGRCGDLAEEDLGLFISFLKEV